jgi:2,3-bisphosphoglycerate-dependent phosphoglycerate mutase
MKNSSGYMLITLFVLAILSCGNFQPDRKETTHYYLLRHAEKAADGTDDPNLSPAGQARALKLVTMLKDQKIDRLYATSFKRTQQTLQPLADKYHLNINIYDHQDPASIKRMIADCKGKTSVIVGHSNTIPHLANTLIGKELYKELEESDYTKMWEILFSGDKVTRHKVISY